MTIAIHCSDIAWGQETGKDLPRQCDLKLELNAVSEFKAVFAEFRLPDAAAVEACLNNGLSKILYASYGQKPLSFSFTWETDFSRMKNLGLKIARRQYTAYCQAAECPKKFSLWLKKQLRDFREAASAG